MASPKWFAASINDVKVVLCYAASKAYFVYSLRADQNTQSINLDVAGSGKNLHVSLPQPDNWKAPAVNVNGQKVAWKAGTGEDAGMMCFCIKLD